MHRIAYDYYKQNLNILFKSLIFILIICMIVEYLYIYYYINYYYVISLVLISQIKVILLVESLGNVFHLMDVYHVSLCR